MIEMTSHTTRNLRPGRCVDAFCDLCGHSNAYFCTRESPYRWQSFVCSNCGLIYASPQPSPAEVNLVNLDNLGDQGSRTRAPLRVLSDSDVRLEDKCSEWALNVIQRFVSVPGKTVMILRCRSGSLNVRLLEEKAEVCGVDPYETNVWYATQRRGLAATFFMPMSRFHDLDVPFGNQFDMVVGLNEHVLAHVMSPRLLLGRLYDLLKPGGYLFLDEKDVLLPTPQLETFVLDSGRAHLFHLTLQTTARYITGAGFELTECEIDKERTSLYKHLRVVARKPETASTPVKCSPVPQQIAGARNVLCRLQVLACKAWLKNRRRVIHSHCRESLKRVPGARQAWRLSRRLFQ